jgi:hypothetical protein
MLPDLLMGFVTAPLNTNRVLCFHEVVGEKNESREEEDDYNSDEEFSKSEMSYYFISTLDHHLGRGFGGFEFYILCRFFQFC